jgi:hypothetical protein
MSDGMKDASRGNHFADLDRPNDRRLAAIKGKLTCGLSDHLLIEMSESLMIKRTSLTMQQSMEGICTRDGT